MATVLKFPAPQPTLARWYDNPQAQALLASLAKRHPEREHFRDDWQQGFRYIGDRVAHLRKIYDRFGEEVHALCTEAYFAIGADAPQAAVDAAYAPLLAWSDEPVDAVIDRAVSL